MEKTTEMLLRILSVMLISLWYNKGRKEGSRRRRGEWGGRKRGRKKEGREGGRKEGQKKGLEETITAFE